MRSDNHYPFPTIQVNGRPVAIAELIDRVPLARTEFESSLFGFIQQWFSEKEIFEQHTSGSTGAPKSIWITRSQMVASAKLTADALRLAPGETALLCMNPEFIGGKMMVVRSFLCGMKLVAVEPSSRPLHGLDIPVDFAAMVPLQVYETVRSGEARCLDTVRTLLIGGGAPDTETVGLLQRYACTCYSTYGMTETISHIALRQLNGEGRSPFFNVFPGIRISRDYRECLIVEWDLLPEPVITNDLVEIRDHTTFVWLGRWDNVINTGGIKIIPEKLEMDVAKIMHSLNLVNRFFLAGIPDPKLGNKLSLFIEGEIDDVKQLQLLQRMSGELPKFHIPRLIVPCHQFITVANGKINRKATVDATRKKC